MSDIKLDPNDPNLLDAIRREFSDDADFDALGKWVEEHNSELSTSQFYEIGKYLSTDEQKRRHLSGAAQARWQKLEKAGGPSAAADAALQLETQGFAVSYDLDGDGRVDPSEKALRKSAVERKAKTVAEGSNTPVDQVVGELEAGLGGSELIPDILVQAMGGRVTYGSDPELDQRVRELITNWNEYNPDRMVSDRAGLFRVLANSRDPDVTNVMDATFLGVDPIVDYKVTTYDGREISIRADQFDIYQQAGFGKSDVLDRAGLVNLVRIADRAGFKDAGGNVNWQMAAALARGSGVDQRQADRSVATGLRDMTDEKKIKAAEAQVNSAGRITRSIARFKEGLLIYNDNDALAYIHSMDPTLAAKRANSPKTMTGAEVKRVRQLINNAGFSQQALSLMGYEALDFEEYDAMRDAASGGGGGGGGRQRPDPVAVRQAARDMWMNLFASEPSEQQLNDLIAGVDTSISGAPSNQSVDVEAQIRKGLESNAQYGELYGSRPAGMSEQEYQTQFRGGAASMLGQEAADPEAIRSGMRSGQYQTTLGRVAGSQQAWGNSTFRGRLAQAAQLVAEST